MSADTTMAPTGEPGRFNGLLRDGLGHIGCSLAPEKIEQLALYAAELRKWNRRINLVARNTTIVDIVERHFIDSLTMVPFLSAIGKKDNILLDVGTGAGFPGLVLAVTRPELHTILVEPRLKRVSFLRHIVRSLQLDNVEIVQARLEETDMAANQRVDWVTCRALAEPGIFLAMVEPRLKRVSFLQHINRYLHLNNVEIINARLEESDILTDRRIDLVTCRALAEPGIFLAMVEPLLQRGTRALLMLGPEQEKRLISELPDHCSVEKRREIRLPWSGRQRFLLAVTTIN